MPIILNVPTGFLLLRFGLAIIGAVILVIGATTSFFIDKLVVVPKGYEFDARVVFLMATVVFVLSTILIPFNVATFCANRLDLNSWTEILVRCLQILISVVLVATVYPGRLSRCCFPLRSSRERGCCDLLLAAIDALGANRS